MWETQKVREQQCFIAFKTQGAIAECFRPNKTCPASFLEASKTNQRMSLLGKVIFKLTLFET